MKKNPEVYEMFKRFTFQAINRGHKNLSSEMIVNRIRWETDVMTTDKDYKINNDYKPFYSRLFMAEHKQYENFLESVVVMQIILIGVAMLYKKVIQQLKYRRIALRIKTDELAYKIGVADSLIHSWESRKKIPNAENFFNWCNALECQVVVHQYKLPVDTWELSEKI